MYSVSQNHAHLTFIQRIFFSFKFKDNTIKRDRNALCVVDILNIVY